MNRQAVFGALLTVSIAALPGPAAGRQEPPTNSAPRPPAEIPLARLKPDAVLALPFVPGAVASDDAVWVPSRSNGSIAQIGSIVRIEAKTNTVGAPIAVGAGPCASLVIAFESVWVPLCGDSAIARVDLKEQQVRAGANVGVMSVDGRITSGAGSVWAVTDYKGVLSRIDPETGGAVAEVFVAAGAVSVEGTKDALWVTSDNPGRLTRVNPYNIEVEEIVAVGTRPGRAAIGEGGVWVLNGDGTVTRVDPKTNKVVATITVGGETAGGDIAAGAGSVWVSLQGAPILRIDPRTNRAVQRFTGDGGGAILVAHGSLWVSAGPQTTWRIDPRLVEAVRP
jgi:streptogramin lyase